MRIYVFFFFFSSRRRHTRLVSDWSSDVCSSDLLVGRLVLLLGWIPRGRGKSPSRLIGTRADGAEIEAALLRLEQELDALPADGLHGSRGKIVPHPLFGALTPPQALR